MTRAHWDCQRCRSCAPATVQISGVSAKYPCGWPISNMAQKIDHHHPRSWADKPAGGRSRGEPILIQSRREVLWDGDAGAVEDEH
jgi:hypothetical protein